MYSEEAKLGASTKQISGKINQLRSKPTQDIERDLRDGYGAKTFVPVGDLDRPFTPSELRDFARERYVFLGNHTVDHPPLTNCSLGDTRRQILEAQDQIRELTGITPISIAYPYGCYSQDVIQISRTAGLKIGFVKSGLEVRANPE